MDPLVSVCVCIQDLLWWSGFKIATVQEKEKENSKFKPVKLCLKIDLVSHSARAEGLVNMALVMCHPVGIRDCSEGIYYLAGKEIDMDFRIIEKYITNV